jgi:hypothetical protein
MKVDALLLAILCTTICLSSENNKQNKVKYNVYYNKEMGYTFHYPLNWKVTFESHYQTAAEEGKGIKNPYPPVILCDSITNEYLEINGRQCHATLNLPQEHYSICLDHSIPKDKWDTTATLINEDDYKYQYLSENAIKAIEIITKSFKEIK